MLFRKNKENPRDVAIEYLRRTSEDDFLKVTRIAQAYRSADEIVIAIESDEYEAIVDDFENTDEGELEFEDV